MAQSKVIAILVAYLPNKDIITGTINSINRQVSNLIIVDNSPDGCDILNDEGNFGNKANISFIIIGENVGIARAQNIGIRKALEMKADLILLSDQDTVFPNHYVRKMLNKYEQLKDKEKVAAIVPDFAETNRKGERQGFTIFNSIFLRRIFPKSGCHVITQAISSGMLIPSEIFKLVGLMDEDLFIDWVDLEWCWRASSKGYKIIGCADVVIEHTLGDVVTKVVGKSYSIRTPIRDYYIIRNAVHLSLRSKYLNSGMRLNTILRSIRYLVGFTILGKPHSQHFSYSLKGFYHGITGKQGVLK